jgi:hypothetical protein
MPDRPGGQYRRGDRDDQPARTKGMTTLTTRERRLLLRELAEIRAELAELSERVDEIAARSAPFGPPNPLV